MNIVYTNNCPYEIQEKNFRYIQRHIPAHFEHSIYIYTLYFPSVFNEYLDV
jgi:hypothetical protein